MPARRCSALQQSGGKLIQRAIPSSGEMLPVVSGAISVRRVGSALHVTLVNTEEAPLVARSETRFSDPWGAAMAQIDGVLAA